MAGAAAASQGGPQQHWDAAAGGQGGPQQHWGAAGSLGSSSPWQQQQQPAASSARPFQSPFTTSALNAATPAQLKSHLHLLHSQPAGQPPEPRAQLAALTAALLLDEPSHALSTHRLSALLKEKAPELWAGSGRGRRGGGGGGRQAAGEAAVTTPLSQLFRADPLFEYRQLSQSKGEYRLLLPQLRLAIKRGAALAYLAQAGGAGPGALPAAAGGGGGGGGSSRPDLPPPSYAAAAAPPALYAAAAGSDDEAF
jgi:hypothetical protein